ncbi:oxidoreductase, 2OG-Fe(II) oxygenase family protein [Seminavis robusta]|uniref:Oxidoreductase, 2OG-Fe(II) oxygenase family protein n=1 Tax=Seminavis robusta TaxID=568900 RepID=A0A9N8DFP1_9STRA|nr:oxidoreductase, 2OG-Fe(II) oxygenase family protein [Seminavis robusta]|eukprot:Sro135_g063660.1 oxidoreductase, 2OG-Fe(II) oxygenase family protein (416) ;mRNA; f:16526-17773
MPSLLSDRCSCPGPPHVDLTEAYIAQHQASSQPPPESLRDCERSLLSNLKEHGWSHVTVRLSDLPQGSPLVVSSADDAMKDAKFQWKNPKESILRLFDDSALIPNATYRTSESGAPGESSVEPKKSWESRRCTSYNNNNQNDEQSEASPLDSVTNALHSIICTVNWLLHLPPNLLIAQRQDTPGTPTRHQYGCFCNKHQDGCNSHGPCNLDLLRVFHYDKVEPPKNQNDAIMGSSPHTDWGSFTVVWQDTVGGLQTYCRTCQAWRDVEASFDDNLLRFVIHVGDATSLAMNCGRELLGDGEHPSSPFFPSPKHRVLSPVTETRVSLVYFVYPSPGQSLESLASGVASWLETDQGKRGGAHAKTPSHGHIPYEHYYLLHDQSESNRNRLPKDVYLEICKRSMEQVFAEKWTQVQRS